MRGRIHSINGQRGMVAVLTDEGGYSIFELLGSAAVEIGVEVRWTDSRPLGSEEVQNVTRHVKFDVFFENHDVSSSNLRQQLRLE